MSKTDIQSLRKIWQNTSFLSRIFSYEDHILIRKSEGQRKPVFWPILLVKLTEYIFKEMESWT